MTHMFGVVPPLVLIAVMLNHAAYYPVAFSPFVAFSSAIDATLAAGGKDFAQPLVFGVLTYDLPTWLLTPQLTEAKSVATQPVLDSTNV